MKTNKLKKDRGFSLVEVTIAIAITAVALIALMGMLPQGMKTMQYAADRAMEARINQQVLGEIQISEWESRMQFDGDIRTYDEQGIAIDESEGTVVYRARIQMVNDDVSLPGGSPDPNLQLVIVQISTVADPNFDFDAADSKRFYRTYQTILAKTGRDFEANP